MINNGCFAMEPSIGNTAILIHFIRKKSKSLEIMTSMVEYESGCILTKLMLQFAWICLKAVIHFLRAAFI